MENSIKTVSIPPDSHIASVHLRVGNLKRMLDFYTGLLGIQQVDNADSTVRLSPTGDSRVLIALTEEPHALPRPPRTSGLYHVAIRVPNRVELARVLQHLLSANYPLVGGADHLVSEALYLTDPEGNGLEIYCDRDRDLWPKYNDQISMSTEPLDFSGLVELARENATPWSQIHPQTDIGHIHLSVSDLAQSEAFYTGGIGFEVTLRSYPGALFLSAGGYHHHLGMNIWSSRRAPPPPKGSLGLISFEIIIPHQTERQVVIDRLKNNGHLYTRREDQHKKTKFLFSDPDSILVEI